MNLDPDDLQPLEYQIHRPEGMGSGAPLLVLLHGRGGDERDLAGLIRLLPEGVVVVTPRAPFEGRPWGYGPGWAWYRYVSGARVVDDTLEASLILLDQFMAKLEADAVFEFGQRYLGGFSQGGTTSLAWALTRPDRLDGVVNLSGFLVESERVEISERSAGGLPVFWGHGLRDPNIPFSLAEVGRDRLRRVGANVHEVDHPGGHRITREEMAALHEWVARPEGPSRTP